MSAADVLVLYDKGAVKYAGCVPIEGSKGVQQVHTAIIKLCDSHSD